MDKGPLHRQLGEDRAPEGVKVPFTHCGVTVGAEPWMKGTSSAVGQNRAAEGVTVPFTYRWVTVRVEPRAKVPFIGGRARSAPPKV